MAVPHLSYFARLLTILLLLASWVCDDVSICISVSHDEFASNNLAPDLSKVAKDCDDQGLERFRMNGGDIAVRSQIFKAEAKPLVSDIILFLCCGLAISLTRIELSVRHRR
jgi:hypothetical protein